MDRSLAPLLAALLVALAPGPGARAEPPLEVHEWGTLTTRHFPDGRAQGGLNRIAPTEVLPDFVHRYEPGAGGPSFTKGPSTPPNPDVTMRLETPVVYFHPAPGELPAAPFDLEVKMRGGILNEFYPAAAASVALDAERLQARSQANPDWTGDVLDNYVAGTLRWAGLRLTFSPELPATSAHVWLTPRRVRAAGVETGTKEGERYLFYRGVAHLDALLGTRLAGDEVTLLSPPNLYWVPREPMKLARVWLAELDANGQAWFQELQDLEVPRLPSKEIRRLSFARAEQGFLGKRAALTAEGGAALKESLRAALVRDGLFEDEADAMLGTWDASWLKSPGRRIFYLVPRAWTDRFLPMTLSVPHTLTRVLVGRIDLIPPGE